MIRFVLYISDGLLNSNEMKYIFFVILLISTFAEARRVSPLQFDSLPSIGQTAAGQDITLGGFSGLQYLGASARGHRFLTLTDRGPNSSGQGDQRPFLLPNYSPRFVYFELDTIQRKLFFERAVPLQMSGKNASGLPQSQGMERPIDIFGRPLAYDKNGLDPEGVCLDTNGMIWIVEEYGPSICQLDPSGSVQKCLKPGSGLPQIYSTRESNRGFEGLVCVGSKLYAFLQSPLPSDGLKSRIVEVDINSAALTAEFFYPFESKKSDKIGDATVLPDGRLAVLERDSKSGPKAFKRLYAIEFVAGEAIVKKSLYRDLVKAGFTFAEKAEGVAVLPDGTIAVLNDNDFGVGGDPDPQTGVFPESGLKSNLLLAP